MHINLLDGASEANLFDGALEGTVDGCDGEEPLDLKNITLLYLRGHCFQLTSLSVEKSRRLTK